MSQSKQRMVCKWKTSKYPDQWRQFFVVLQWYQDARWKQKQKEWTNPSGNNCRSKLSFFSHTHTHRHRNTRPKYICGWTGDKINEWRHQCNRSWFVSVSLFDYHNWTIIWEWMNGQINTKTKRKGKRGVHFW